MKSFLELVEETKQGEKHHVMTFGRMNPPTTGHLKLIDKVKDVADKNKANHSIVVSHSQDSKKNPLSGETKVKHLKRYSPGTHIESSSKEHPTFLHHAEKLHKSGVTHLHMVVGSDRVKEMKEKLHQYNGTHKGALYNYKKITVHSAGHRDPDAEGSEGMSGTKMRSHATSGNFKEFKKGVPGHVADHHAKELYHDTRKGMGIHENINRGLFKAIFVTGGPGSGKDVIIREAIAESRAVELNATQAFDYLADKQKLAEKTSDFRRESIRNRGPLIINGPADSIDKINHIKEELEELGYSTMMVFVNTTNEISQERNTKLSRMMVESIRYDKWSQAQKNKRIFSESFDDFIQIDNTGSLESIEEDITNTYININAFIENKSYNDVSLLWLENHGKLNIGDKLDIIKEERNVKSVNKFIQIKINRGLTAAGLDSIPADNRAGDSNADDIKWNAPKRTKTYIFRTYSEESKPTLTINPVPKEANFSKDKEKVKNKKRFSDAPTVSQRLRNTTGIGPEFDTRQQGTVYPMSGLGDVTYREQKEFSKFRKVLEAIDDPGAVDMGVGGVLNGATNKEPLQTYKDADKNIGVIITKKKKSIKEDRVEKLESGLKKLQKTDYDSIDKLMMKISKDENITGKDLHNDFVKKHGKVPDNWIKDKKQEK
jgi:phosphopantetheine adenylyltransferase/predicted kinase